MDISVIIPVYNGEKHIITLLNSLRSQKTEKQYEIIVVDNGSDDNTADLAKRNGAKVVYKEKGYHISSVRNEGAKHAHGEIIAFIDADCEAPNDWLIRGYNTLKDSDDIGIIGGQYMCPNKSTWVQRAWDSVRLRGIHGVNFVTSGDLFIKRDVFNKYEGFNEKLETGEDYDLCLRVSQRYRVVSDDRLNVVHYGDPATLRQKLIKEMWYGKNVKDILKTKPLYIPFWLSILFLTNIFAILVGLILINIYIFIGAIISIITFAGIISFLKCYRARNFKHYLPLTVVYLVYFLGRALSLKWFLR